MKKLFIIANWKSYKKEKEVQEWLETFIKIGMTSSIAKELIICPSFPFLIQIKTYIQQKNVPIYLGAQDISPFVEGAYTGEVNGEQLTEYVTYVLVGHSERRLYFHEDDAILQQKVIQARSVGIEPIYCVRGEDDAVPKDIAIVAYEPFSAIGTGIPDTPENANTIARKIKEKYNSRYVLYGGSVTSANVHSFIEQPHIDGVLVGSASLDPREFSKIIEYA